MFRKYCSQVTKDELKGLLDGTLPRHLENILNNHIDYCFHCQINFAEIFDGSDSRDNVIDFPIDRMKDEKSFYISITVGVSSIKSPKARS